MEVSPPITPAAPETNVLRHVEHRHCYIKGVRYEEYRHKRFEKPFEKHKGVNVVHIVFFHYHAD